MRVGKTFSFDSGHFLPGYAGRCSRDHGHMWRIEVVVEGKKNPDTGMVVDFSDLKRIVDDAVYRDDVKWDLDHNHLNKIVDNPTAEVLCAYILKRVRTLWGESKLSGRVIRLRLWEKYEVKEAWAEIEWEELYDDGS